MLYFNKYMRKWVRIFIVLEFEVVINNYLLKMC